MNRLGQPGPQWQASVRRIRRRHLQVVQVQVVDRRHHYVVPLIGGSHAAIGAAPGHHRRPLREPCFDLIKRLPRRASEARIRAMKYACRWPCRRRRARASAPAPVARRPIAPGAPHRRRYPRTARETTRRFRPAPCREQRRWTHPHRTGGMHAALVGHLQRLRTGAQPRGGGDARSRMSRDVDLRHDGGDVVRGRVPHQVADLRQAVPATSVTCLGHVLP
jgi:hypothetical protein